MAEPYPENPLLQGAFAPLRSECDGADLAVEGRLPPGLEGTLYRIGPNPQFAPRGTYNPLQGDGMIHAFRLDGGRVRYRNRWVRTRQWILEREAGRALFATANPREHDPAVASLATDGVANTHIVPHAGRLFALEEGHGPIEIEGETLATLGPFDFGGKLRTAMTAHPKRDPVTGELVFFANFPTRRFDGTLAFYVANSEGEIVRSSTVQGPYPALVHDFAITATHVVFIVCPLTLSLDRLRAGRAPIAWEPERSDFVGLMARTDESGKARWFEAPPSMVWHTLNAFDDDGRVVVDLCQQQAPAFPTADGIFTPEPQLQQHLTRWTIDPRGTGSIAIERLSDVVCEYPRIDERRSGLAYRYGYFAAQGGSGTGDLLHRAIGRFDHARSEMTLWHAGERRAVSEPVFVARPGTHAEGVGFLLATVFDETTNTSHLAVLDAERIADGPVMRAHHDTRVPMGFHGSFVAG